MEVLNAYKEAFLHLPEGIDAAEAVAETEAEQTVTLAKGVHNGSAFSDVTSLFVRTQGEKAGFAYTQNLDEDPADVLARAYESSKYAQTEGMPIPETGEFTYTLKEETCELTELAVLWKKAEQTDQWLNSQFPELTVQKLSVTDRIRTVSVVSSKGTDCRTSSHCFCVSVFASDVRYPGSFLIRELTAVSLEELRPEQWNRVVQRWYWTLEAQKQECDDFESGMYRCVLDGSVLNNIFLTGWRMFAAGNYKKSTTPFAGKMQEKIASFVVNITDCAVRDGSGYVYRADCEGIKGSKAVLVSDGIMKGCISSMKDCDRGCSTGNAGRKDMISGTIHTDVVTMPKNFGMEPGKGLLETLLEKMNDGMYIYESYDMFHSVNTVSGDYAIPCNGIRIKDGKPAGVIKGLTLNGRVQNLLQEIEELDSEISVQPMLMLNSFTVSAPDALVHKLSISR